MYRQASARCEPAAARRSGPMSTAPAARPRVGVTRMDRGAHRKATDLTLENHGEPRAQRPMPCHRDVHARRASVGIAALAMVVRLPRSRGLERTQLKWIALGATWPGW